LLATRKRKGLASASTPPRRREYADTPAELVEAVDAARGDARPKAKITVSIDAELADELKAAGDTHTRKQFPSVSALAERGIRAGLERLRADHNQGDPFE